MVKKEELKVVKPSERTQEELLREIEELRTKLNFVPQDLESRIVFYKQQELNVKRLSKINKILETLNEIQKGVNETKDEFETDKYQIEIKAPNPAYGHRTETMLNIGNLKTIASIICNLIEQTKLREEEIKQLIIA